MSTQEFEFSILNYILWTDEFKFSNNGILSRHNSHNWTDKNPYWVRETKFQTVLRVNIWCGIIGNQIIGPHYYEGKYNKK